MGKDKLRRFEENKGFTNLFQADFEQVYQTDYYMKGMWSSQYFHNSKLIVLELGCGKGEYTLELARQFPECNYIGVDIKGARLWRGAKTAIEEKMDNVAFLRTRIELIDHFFAPEEVAGIWITFPDPQPKRPNKRLTSPRFLKRYLSFLATGGIVRLKTDSLGLHLYTRQLVEEWDGATLQEACTDIYGTNNAAVEKESSAMPSIVTSVKTFYERQFLAAGKPITYLQFAVDNPAIALPEVLTDTPWPDGHETPEPDGHTPSRDNPE